MESHAIVIADRDGVIRMWSEGAERLFGHAADDALGRSLDLIVPERHRDRHWQGYRAAMEAGEAGGGTARLPVTCDGDEEVEFPTRFSILKDASDEVVGAMAIFSPQEDA